MHNSTQFWAKVEKTEDCWFWRGAVDRDGYGLLGWCGSTRRAHRIAYELACGPIDTGLTIDHLCRVRHCVRPDHLEPVTQAENTRRGTTWLYHSSKTHCPQGHEYTPANTMPSGRGGRACRECGRIRQRRRYQERKVRAR